MVKVTILNAKTPDEGYLIEWDTPLTIILKEYILDKYRRIVYKWRLKRDANNNDNLRFKREDT